MGRSVIALSVLAGVLVIAAGQAFAEQKVEPRQPEVRLLNDAAVIHLGPETPLAVADCQVGNLNPPAWAIGSWLMPPEEYKLVFDPSPCADCPGGFQVTAVHIFLQIAAACTLHMSVDVERADLSNPQCPWPGPEECVSDMFEVFVSQAGIYDIALPINCGCLCVDGTYLLSVWFEAITAPVDIVTDAFPTPCTSWNNWGSGWVDLVTGVGFPGNLVIFADAVCCASPSAVERTTWGTVKEAYR